MIVVHANFPIDPARQEEALELAETLVEQSNQEPGMIDYRASVDIVDISPANATVTRGDPLTVVATLATTGEVADRTVTLRSNGTVLGNRTVELAGGGNTTVTFADVATDPLRPGAHALTVATADGAASAALTVERATRGRHESGVARPVFEAVAGADGVLDRADVLGMVADYATRRPTNGVALTRTQVLALVRYYAVEH